MRLTDGGHPDLGNLLLTGFNTRLQHLHVCCARQLHDFAAGRKLDVLLVVGRFGLKRVSEHSDCLRLLGHLLLHRLNLHHHSRGLHIHTGLPCRHKTQLHQHQNNHLNRHAGHTRQRHCLQSLSCVEL